MRACHCARGSQEPAYCASSWKGVRGCLARTYLRYRLRVLLPCAAGRKTAGRRLRPSLSPQQTRSSRGSGRGPQQRRMVLTLAALQSKNPANTPPSTLWRPSLCRASAARTRRRRSGRSAAPCERRCGRCAAGQTRRGQSRSGQSGRGGERGESRHCVRRESCEGGLRRAGCRRDCYTRGLAMLATIFAGVHLHPALRCRGIVRSRRAGMVAAHDFVDLGSRKSEMSSEPPPEPNHNKALVHQAIDR